MNKQMNTICKPQRIRLFALIINFTILIKTNSRFFPEYISSAQGASNRGVLIISEHHSSKTTRVTKTSYN